MTIVAAAEVIAAYNTHSEIEVLEVQWGIAGRYDAPNKASRVVGLVKIAMEETIQVFTESGKVTLARALVETALKAPTRLYKESAWIKLVNGLRFDGFEVVMPEIEVAQILRWPPPENPPQKNPTTVGLVRMLPKDIPGLDFREAESPPFLSS